MRYVILIICSLMTVSNKTLWAESEDVSQPDADVTAQSLARGKSIAGKSHYDKNCAACHDGNLKKAPHKDMIGLMTPEAILDTITVGIMKDEASTLSTRERKEIAVYLSGAQFGQNVTQLPQCGVGVKFNIDAPAVGSNWGLKPDNSRHIDASGLSSSTVGRLKPKWAIAFPGASRVRSQPTFAGALIFVGSHGGKVYALDQQTGCALWSYQAAAEVRTGIVVGPWTDQPPSIYFGDVLGNVYGISAGSGELSWRIRADDHPNATITGTPTLHAGTVYVPVSSLEVSLAVNPQYECCTFRGSILALDAQTGKVKWRTYTIASEPAVTGKNPVGTNIMGPSGAVVWNSPSIDAINNQLFIGTGENMSSPASLTSDAIIAMNLDTGRINWTFQATANDVWNTACDTSTPENCPFEGGPDFDFGAATMIIDTSRGAMVIAGQKSGIVHALDPRSGEVIWQTRVGRGGIQGGIHFGMAAKNGVLFVPISDWNDGRTYKEPVRPGMHALEASSGKILWSTIHTDNCDGRNFCHPGISQVPTVIGDLVFAGSMDGTARAYAVDTGKILWQLDTTGTFATTLNDETTGGTMGGGAGPIAFDGILLLSSGYGLYGHKSGNLFLALEITN